MSTRSWSHRELKDFVNGKVLTLFVAGSFVAIPESLVALGGVPTIYTDTMEITERIHPDDRNVLSAMSVDAWNAPGEVVRGSYRFLWGEEWMRFDTEMVNLIGTEIGGLLTASVYTPLADGTGPQRRPQEWSGDDGAVHWMLETVDVTGVVLSVEGAVEEMLGRKPEDVIGRNHRDFLHPDSYNELYTAWVEMLHRPTATRVARRRFVRLDETELWAECAYVSRLRADGTGDVLVYAVDITARMEQEVALRRGREELRLLAEQVPAAVFRADGSGRVTFTNHRWRHLLGEHADIEWLRDLARAEDRERIDRVLAHAHAGDGGVQRVEVAGPRGGRRLAVSLREVRDPVTGQGSFVGSVDDVTSTAALRHRADHDDLTGLLSRRAFEERVAAVLDAEPGRGAVGFVDLDRFKDVNDLYGHDAGDAVLVAIARRLRHSLRDADEIGRYGGDEFVVFCPGIEDASAVADRLADACRDPVSFDTGVWWPAASVGVALARAGESVGELVRRADRDMFSVKRSRPGDRAPAPVGPFPGSGPDERR